MPFPDAVDEDPARNWTPDDVIRQLQASASFHEWQGLLWTQHGQESAWYFFSKGVGISAQVYCNIQRFGLVAESMHERISRLESLFERLDLLFHACDVVSPFGIQPALESPVVEDKQTRSRFVLVGIQRHHE